MPTCLSLTSPSLVDSLFALADEIFSDYDSGDFGDGCEPSVFSFLLQVSEHFVGHSHGDFLHGHTLIPAIGCCGNPYKPIATYYYGGYWVVIDGGCCDPRRERQNDS